MKAIKIVLMLVTVGICGCTISPNVPVLTSDHPASAEAAEGKVEIPSIPLTKTPGAETNSHTNKGMAHEMSKMSKKVGDK